MWPARQPFAYATPVWRNSHLLHLAGRAFRNIQKSVFPPAVPTTVFDSIQDRPVRQSVVKTKRLFAAIRTILEKDSIPLLVVMIPTLNQVRVSGSHPGVGARHGKDWTGPNREFASFFDSLAINHIDLLPAMATPEGATFYFKVDQHWNSDGHRHAAEAMVPRIRLALARSGSSRHCGAGIPPSPSHAVERKLAPLSPPP